MARCARGFPTKSRRMIAVVAILISVLHPVIPRLMFGISKEPRGLTSSGRCFTKRFVLRLAAKRERHQRRHIAPQVVTAVMPCGPPYPLLRSVDVLDHQR